MSIERPSIRFIGLCLSDFDTALEAATDSGFDPNWLDGQWARDAYRVLQDMHTKRLPIDSAFAAEHAEGMGLRISAKHFRTAEDCAPTQRNGGDSIVALLKKEYIERQVENIAERLRAPSPDPLEAACKAAADLMALSGKDQTHIEDAVEEVCEGWREAHAGRLHGLPMPWTSVFERTAGVEPGQVGLFVGHGGSGKSAAILQWARFASRNGWPSLVFPFEDGLKGAIRRLAGMDASVNVFKLRLGRGTDEELGRAVEAARGLPGQNIYLSAKRGDLTSIFATAQQYVIHHGVRAIFLDAFKDIRGTHDLQGENSTMAGIVDMADRLKVPVIVSHHVRKQGTQLKGTPMAHHISKDDLRGSARLWDDSRFVLALQQYPTMSEDSMGNIVWEYLLQILKTNHGITGLRQPVHRTHTLEFEEIVKPV